MRLWNVKYLYENSDLFSNYSSLRNVCSCAICCRRRRTVKNTTSHAHPRNLLPFSKKDPQPDRVQRGLRVADGFVFVIYIPFSTFFMFPLHAQETHRRGQRERGARASVC